MAGRTKFHLTEKQFLELEQAESQVKNPKLLKKIQCLKLKNIWREHKKVADFLKVRKTTISDWTKLYFEKGLDGLLARNYKGKPPILTAEQLRELSKKNKKTPFATAKEARNYIKEKYGIIFHLHRVQKLLKKKLWFSYKKQKIMPWKHPSEAVQKEFIKEYELLLSEANE